jgi:hypothetical protein
LKTVAMATVTLTLPRMDDRFPVGGGEGLYKGRAGRLGSSVSRGVGRALGAQRVACERVAPGRRHTTVGVGGRATIDLPSAGRAVVGATWQGCA